MRSVKLSGRSEPIAARSRSRERLSGGARCLSRPDTALICESSARPLFVPPGRNQEPEAIPRETTPCFRSSAKNPRRIAMATPGATFLKIGGLAMGGLALPQVLKAQAATESLKLEHAIAQSGHHDLPVRRPLAPGHVRPQDERARPRSVARSARSPPMSPASRSASTCRGSPR